MMINAKGRISRGLKLRACVLVSVGAAMVALSSCTKDSSTDDAEATEAVQTVLYTVRGIIAQLPDPMNPASMLMVRHESMPHYRRPDGALGMNSMTMPFPLANGLSLEGWAVGDQIELAFEVDYDVDGGSIRAFRATGLTALSDDTQLDFSPLP